MASQADRHRLYELSVQCAESEVDFVEETYKTLKGHGAQSLREDFCGTAAVCCEWVKRGDTHQAIGVDLDSGVLQWGRDNRLSELNPGQKKRVTLLEENVLSAKTAPADMIMAMNFSYWLFKERPALLNYFKTALANLNDEGILFLDAFGGSDSFTEIEEEREIDGEDFTYIWDQAKFNPINHDLLCHIHFSFADGSTMNEAFTYDWRLWTLPEIREVLLDAGFSKVTIYWQGWDKNGEPDAEFKPATVGEADAGWICYIAAEK